MQCTKVFRMILTSAGQYAPLEERIFDPRTPEQFRVTLFNQGCTDQKILGCHTSKTNDSNHSLITNR